MLDATHFWSIKTQYECYNADNFTAVNTTQPTIYETTFGLNL